MVNESTKYLNEFKICLNGEIKIKQTGGGGGASG